MTARRRRLRRLAPLVVLAAGAFVGGLVAGGRHEPSERRLAARFAAAWERADYAAMYAMLAPASRERVSLRRFARAYREAAATATLTRLEAGEPESAPEGRVEVSIDAGTRVFGELRGAVTLPLAADGRGEPAVAWAPHLAFPGLRPGERLSRRTRMPERAMILARHGTPIAKGEARLSELDPVASEIAGRLGPAPPEQAEALRARGVPPDTPVGLTGLEREFDSLLAGTPGGELLAGRRVLASVAPRAGRSVRSTIDPEIQRAAVEALAGRFGGIAAVRPRNGEVLGLAGVAFSAPQPPGSVFKIVTLAGALEAGVVKRRQRFPVQTAATLEGVELQNANGEACGGSLIESFAHSCNSVFAPMGAELGAERLVRTAERFGFNRDPRLVGAARSTIPAASEIGDDLAVGSTAIGQGKVLATPLRMALIAAAIAEGGRLVEPTLLKGERTPSSQVVPPRVARFIGRAMRAVVTGGTGVGAAIPGVKVAGKTGTAELRSTVSQDPVPDPNAPAPADPTDTDAWFAAYAPARRPRLAVSVLLIAQGAGGETAAPAAREVLEAAVGPERAAEIIGRLSAIIEMRPFEFLRRIPAEQIYASLRNEAPQTIALTVANLHTTIAGQVLAQLPQEEQVEVARRIAVMSETSPDVVKDVEKVMRRKLSNVLSQDYAATGGIQGLADILNGVDRNTERNVLESLGGSDPDLAEEVRLLLFVFEDVVKLENRSVQMVLKEVNQKDLALALRGASEEVLQKILTNMSSRGAEMLQEEMKYQPPQRRSAVEEAQGRIVGVIRRLEDQGVITIGRGGEDDEVV